jgi:hypothetical protein
MTSSTDKRKETLMKAFSALSLRCKAAFSLRTCTHPLEVLTRGIEIVA